MKSQVLEVAEDLPYTDEFTAAQTFDLAKVDAQLQLYVSVLTNAGEAVLVLETGKSRESVPRIVFVNEPFSHMTGYTAREVLSKGTGLFKNSHPESSFQRHLLKVLESRQLRFVAMAYTTKHEGEAWGELSIVPLVSESGDCLHFAVVMRDITARKQADAALLAANSSLNHHVQLVAVLNQIANTKVVAGDLQEVTKVIMGGMMMISGASRVVLGLLDDAQTELTIYADSGSGSVSTSGQNGAASLPGIVLSLNNDSLIQQLIVDEQPVHISDIQPDPRFKAYYPLLHALDSSDLILIPMQSRGVVIGLIAAAFNRSGYPFCSTDLSLFKAIAEQATESILYARLFVSEQEQRRLAEERSRELSTLFQVTRTVATTLELEPLLDLILDQLAQIVEYTGSVIMDLEDDELRVLAYRGPTERKEVIGRHYPAVPFLENIDLFRDNGTAVASDLLQAGQIQRLLAAILGDDMRTLQSYSRSWLGVPLMVGQRIIGLLCVGHGLAGYFNDIAPHMISAFAGQIAIAIDNAKLYRRSQTAAVDAERSRLARDLHDAVTQTLFSASIVAEALPDAWAELPEIGKQGTEQVIQLTRSALAEMRTLLVELRPAALLQKPIREILEPLIEAFASRTGVFVTLKVKNNISLPPNVQVAVYRIIQESLNNILKHAGAQNVFVSLTCQPEKVKLQISDDGVGFDIAAVAPDRLGLQIMRERALSIGATFCVASETGQGTQIDLVWKQENSVGEQSLERLFQNRDIQ